MAGGISKKEMQEILSQKGLKHDISSMPDEAVITNYDLSKDPITINYIINK